MGRKTKEIVYSGCHVFSWMAIHIFMSIYFKWAWVTQKYFFLLNKSLQLFETYCTFLWVVKITKSSHHLLHNRASKGMGLYLVWRHREICILVSLCKHGCKAVCDVKPGKDSYPLLAQSCNRWWPDFITFGKKVQCVANRCKDLFKQKKIILGLLHFNVFSRRATGFHRRAKLFELNF